MATAGTALKRIRICEEHDPQAGGVLKGQPSALTDAAQPVNPLPAGEANLKKLPCGVLMSKACPISICQYTP